MDLITRFFVPEAVSTFANDVDRLFMFIMYLCLFFFILIVVGTTYFVVKYRRRGAVEKTSGIDNHHALEVFWTVVPSIILLVLFFWGFLVYFKMGVTPRYALQIKATGQRWFWTFDYPNGYVSTAELVVPVDKPVELLISSRDVLHSLFIPNFRFKMDAVPNRYTVAWFQATKTGSYPIYCAEFCGASHSQMLATVKVLSESDYQTWLNNAAAADTSLALDKLGEKLYQEKACFTCHTLDGKAGIGPTFKGIFGRNEKLADGGSIKVDENYIRESILEPMKKVVAGYAPAMPTYQGLLKEREVDGLIAYLKTLK